MAKFVHDMGVIVFVTALTVVAILCEYIVLLFIRIYQYMKWKKENNIKEKYRWNRWSK